MNLFVTAPQARPEVKATTQLDALNHNGSYTHRYVQVLNHYAYNIQPLNSKKINLKKRIRQ